MGRQKGDPVKPIQRRRKVARTPEERENQLVGLAYDLVEQRMLAGTATSQETTYFLKLGSQKERYELERMKKENKLLEAKTESLESAKRVEELYKKAMDAFRDYSGQGANYEEVEEL